MGKGSRKRRSDVSENKHAMRAREDAAKLDKKMHAVCIVIILLLVITLFMQVWSQWLMYANLNAGVYEAKGNAAEDIATLQNILPGGTVGTALIALGSALALVLLFCKRPKLSLIGFGVAVLGSVLFVLFALDLTPLFPPVATDSEIGTRGLTFVKTLWRYYSLLVPVVMLLIPVTLGIRAQQKREIAEVMESAMSEESTLSLDE